MSASIRPFSRGTSFQFLPPRKNSSSSLEESTQAVAIRSIQKRKRDPEEVKPHLRTKVKALPPIPCTEELDPEDEAYWTWFEANIAPFCQEEGPPTTDPKFLQLCEEGPLSSKAKEPSVFDSPFDWEEDLSVESSEESESVSSETDSPFQERRVAEIPVTAPEIFYQTIFSTYYPIDTRVKYQGHKFYRIGSLPTQDGCIQIKNAHYFLNAKIRQLKPTLNIGQTVLVLHKDAYLRVKITDRISSKFFTDLPGFSFSTMGNHVLHRILPLPSSNVSSQTI